MANWSRWALGISGALALGSAIGVYLGSPELVPVHYGLMGTPDRWGSPTQVLIVQASVVCLGTALFFALPELIRRAPSTVINLPNKEYWLLPEHRDSAAAKFAQWASSFGTAQNALMLALQQLLAPHRDGTVAVASYLPVLAILGFLLFTLASCVWLLWAYRLPTHAE